MDMREIVQKRCKDDEPRWAEFVEVTKTGWTYFHHFVRSEDTSEELFEDRETVMFLRKIRFQIANFNAKYGEDAYRKDSQSFIDDLDEGDDKETLQKFHDWLFSMISLLGMASSLEELINHASQELERIDTLYLGKPKYDDMYI